MACAANIALFARSQGMRSAEQDRTDRSGCGTHGWPRTVKHAKQADHLAALGVHSELRGGTAAL